MRVIPMACVALALVGCGEPDLGIQGNQGLAGTDDKPDLSPPAKTDVITQVVKPEVDVLWVIDDSGSMCDKQDKLANAFPMFMEFFLDSGLDYHIGVTSMDTTSSGLNGRLASVGTIRYITPQTQDPVAVFSQMARLGCSGSATENGSIAAFHAIEQPTPLQQQANASFIREDAALHVIAMTDERDNSYSGGWSFSANEFINWLNGFKGDLETTVSFSAIAGPVPGGCRMPGGGTFALVEPCVPYPNIAREVGRVSPDEPGPGQFYSICDADWEPFLEELGLLASALRREYFLTEMPTPGTIEVIVETVEGSVLEGIDVADLPIDYDGADIDAACRELGAARCFDFEYVPPRNSVELPSYVPPPQSKMRITYELRSGAGESTDFEFGGDTATP